MRLPIPIPALDDRLGFVGVSGSGKTWAAGTAVEAILDRRARVVIIDPLGVWWGLRLTADGKRPSKFDVVIFGGEHGDLPLNEAAGALIGETVAGIAQSCIVDLSGFGTKAGGRRFMAAFLTALYRHANRELVHLIFDEADMWSPQRLLDKEGDAAKLLGMMETIVRRGRVLGFIPWLITQRPAVLSKDVLSQVDGLSIMKLTSSQDRDAIGDWVEGQADKAQWRSIWGSLPTYQVGHGLLWMPGRSIFQTVQFPAKVTFDSSRAPRRGEQRTAAKLQPLDLPTLREKLSTVEAEAAANDPAALRREIARIKAQGASEADIDAADQRGYARGRADAVIEADRALALFEQAWEEVAPHWPRLAEAVTALMARNSMAYKAGTAQPVTRPISSALPKPPAPIKQIAPAGDLPNPQRRILASLSFWQSVGHEAPTRPMVAAVAGYTPSSGGFNNLIGAMRTAGLLDVPSPGCVNLTVGGKARTNGGMTIAEAREFILSVLSGPQRKLIEAAANVTDITRETLAKRSGYTASSGGFNNLVGSLCTLDIFAKPRPGTIALSEWAHQVIGGS